MPRVPGGALAAALEREPHQISPTRGAPYHPTTHHGDGEADHNGGTLHDRLSDAPVR